MLRPFAASALLAVLLAACDKPASGGSVACGLAALAGPTTLLSEFGVPGQALGRAPDNLPERLVTRLAAGPSYPAIVGRTDSAWIVGVEGTMPAGTKPGFGVLVLDQTDRARGIMLYESQPIENAAEIGKVTVGATTVPLLGVQTDPTRFEDPRCPFFPDSVLK